MNELETVLDDALGLGLSGEGRWFRADVSRGIALRDGQPPVDRAQGIIYNYAVITKGPALGHNMTVDDKTLAQVVELGNKSANGIKSRFDHPNASNTSMGTYLGRTKNFRRVGDRVLADLHLSPSAKEAPQGDLHSYVLGLAQSDPQAFGASIVFEGKTEFQLNEDGSRQADAAGKPLPGFARVEKLLASDVVDEPAANPGGLFSQPDGLAGKVTAFLNRWAQHDLVPQLMAMLAAKKEEPMSDAVKPDAVKEPNSAQVEAAKAEAFAAGHADGVKTERERVAGIRKAFTSVWGANPPAEEARVCDGLIELGIGAAEAETDFKRRKLTAITAAAPVSVGGGDATADESQLSTEALSVEDRCKAEWEQDKGGVRGEFLSLEHYVAFARADARGAIKVLGGKVSKGSK